MTQERSPSAPSARPMLGSALATLLWPIEPMKTGTSDPSTMRMVWAWVRPWFPEPAKAGRIAADVISEFAPRVASPRAEHSPDSPAWQGL